MRSSLVVRLPLGVSGRKLFLVLSVAFMPVGCTGSQPSSPTLGATTGPTAAATAAHWTYDGEEGPEHWGELSADYAPCAAGRSQSPIDVANADPADLANITFAYQPAELEIVNNGHTVQVNYPPGSSITVDGKSFELAQFHFHAPSEHRVNGIAAAAELHLVHRASDTALAVVGILLTEGAANTALAPVFANLPPDTGPAVTVAGVQVDPTGMLPPLRTTYRYAGSLTTPPCTEGVTWLLMTEPLEVSADQLAAYVAIYDGNNRPVQPVNDREVVEDTTP